MAFNEKKFMKTNFTPRTKDVSVPDMRDFFDPDTDPVFRVRGLTGPELARVHEAVDKHRDIAGMITGLLSGQSQEKIDSIRKACGITGDDVPAEIARRLEMITIACIDPVLPLDVAVKFCETYPIEFYDVTGMISKLTGQGQIPGKPKPSGATPASKQP
jgi:hypothetical protein